MNILIINGPNLNMLGEREPEIYGKHTYKDLVKQINLYAKSEQFFVKTYQSNHEGKIIDYIQKKHMKYDGIIINPGALTHYSYALRDCLAGVQKRVIEVHLSDIYNREDFRKISVLEDIVERVIVGKGINGYLEAIDLLLKDDHYDN
jgi:3-dehydroquinate dehydratase-2